MQPTFTAGRNIAMKVPPHQYDATVAFYRDVLGFEQRSAPDDPDVRFAFGEMTLWIDKVPTVSQAELWLEVVADDTAAAGSRLTEAGIVRCDAIEPLPAGFDGFWISSPAAIIHLVAGPKAI